MNNKVKKIRTQLSISQRELAERAGTSQQQIQRIEAGKITTSLTVAKAICIALGKPLEIVFPDAAKALNELRKDIEETRYVTDAALSKVSDSGIEADGQQWWLKMLLKGRQEPLILAVAAEEKRRLYSLIQSEMDGSAVQFLVFDSAGTRYAINLAEVSFCQFLFDPLASLGAPSASEEKLDSKHNVSITMAGRGSSIELYVGMDEPDEDEGAQLGHLFELLESGAADASERCRIVDADGEDAFVRVGSIAVLKVALWALGGTTDDDEISE